MTDREAKRADNIACLLGFTGAGLGIFLGLFVSMGLGVIVAIVLIGVSSMVPEK